MDTLAERFEDGGLIMRGDEEMTDDGLAGKVVVVTGASSGIGEAVAEQLGQRGCRMVLGARRVDRLTDVVARMRDRGSVVEPVTTDVRDEASARRLVEHAGGVFGRVDAVVNNAGVMLHSPLRQNLSGEWRQMVETNLLGAMYISAAAIPWFERAGSGDIVNVSSIAGHRPRARGGPYAATKFGIRALSESLRLELQELNVRVIVVSPGVTDTELPSHITDEETIAVRARQAPADLEPLESGDVADAIAWALARPSRMSVNELVIRPTRQVN